MRDTELLLGIDWGTSGTKTVLFDTLGNAIASHTVEYPLYQPRNGWAEQDPHDWWRAVQETVQAVLAKSEAYVRHILLPKDYVRYKLTGEFTTEVSDTSGMNLLDMPKQCLLPRTSAGAAS